MASLSVCIAECGHEYEGYAWAKARARCPRCVRALAAEIDHLNQLRAVTLANVGRGRHFKVSRSRRLRIYERDQWACQLCGQPVDPNLNPSDDQAASLDHIKCQSWSLEPDHTDTNLRLAHRSCNWKRGDEGVWASNLAATRLVV